LPTCAVAHVGTITNGTHYGHIVACITKGSIASLSSDNFIVDLTDMDSWRNSSHYLDKTYVELLPSTTVLELTK
jgi:hypothetical protein